MSYKINYTTEEKIKLAKDDSVEKLYNSKKNQRTVRVLTVMAYVLTVSLAGLVLSTYYIFFWKMNANAKPIKSLKSNNGTLNQQHRVNCDLLIVPENIAIRLLNGTDVSIEAFYDEIIKNLPKLHPEAFKSHSKPTTNGFNRYKQDEGIDYNSHGYDRNMRKKLMRSNSSSGSNKKKIVDDEDLNVDMESSGDKDQAPPATTYLPLITSESPDLNDTTIIFDQDPEE